MLVVDAAQPRLVQRLVLLPAQHRILLDQPVERGREADVVLPVLRGDGEDVIGGGERHAGAGRGGLAGAQPVAGAHSFGLGDRNHVAALRMRSFRRPVALDGEQRPDAHRIAGGGSKLGAFLKRAAEDAGEREAAHRAGVGDLEDEGAAFLGTKASRGRVGPRRVVAERFQETAHSEAVQRGAEEDRHDQVLPRLARQVFVDGFGIGRFVHQELLEKRVVMVGELLHQVEPRRLFALGQVRRDVGWLGRLAGPVVKGPLQRDVDEAADLLAVPDRYLPGEEGLAAHRLERFEDALDAAARLVDLVDEDHVRDAEPLEHAERRLGEDGALRVRIDDDEREVRRGDAERAVRREADRARAIDQRISVAEKLKSHQVEFRGAAARAGFGARVADARSARDIALPVDRAGREEKGLGEAGLAGAAGSDERDGSGALGFFGVGDRGHERLLRPLRAAREEDAVPRR